MLTYIGLLKFTDKGLATIKDTTRRATAAKEMGRRFGVNMREVFWTMGEYDVVCVIEADDEQSIAAFDLAIATQGNVRTTSLRAFTADEMEQVVAKLP